MKAEIEHMLYIKNNMKRVKIYNTSFDIVMNLLARTLHEYQNMTTKFE